MPKLLSNLELQLQIKALVLEMDLKPMTMKICFTVIQEHFLKPR